MWKNRDPFRAVFSSLHSFNFSWVTYCLNIIPHQKSHYHWWLNYQIWLKQTPYRLLYFPIFLFFKTISANFARHQNFRTTCLNSRHSFDNARTVFSIACLSTSSRALDRECINLLLTISSYVRYSSVKIMATHTAEMLCPTTRNGKWQLGYI